jgi:hypothetical protein
MFDFIACFCKASFTLCRPENPPYTFVNLEDIWISFSFSKRAKCSERRDVWEATVWL